MPRRPTRRRRRRNKTQYASVSQVKSLITRKQETLVHRQVVDRASISNSGTFYHISDVPTASREGLDIEMKLLRLRFNMYALDETNNMRLILLRTKGEFIPTTASEILENYASFTDPTVPLISWESRFNFEILMDRVFTLSNDIYYSGAANHHTNKYLVKNLYKNVKIHYNPSSTDGANQIYLLAISDSSVLSHPVLTYHSELHYKDS